MAAESDSPVKLVRVVRSALLILVALGLVAYFVDFAWYELRAYAPKFGSANGTVHRIRLLAIPTKGNKIEYEIDAVHPEEDVPCSHSLFPHGGYPPCWYLSRNPNQPIPM
jgi:hypothetical protein